MSFQEQLHEEIIKKFSPGSDKLLVCPSPIDWDWPKAQRGYILQQEYNLVGYMPQPIDKDKPYYAKSNKEIFDAYSTVIRAVKSIPPDEYLQQVSDLDDQIRASKAKLDEDMTYMMDQMKDAKTDEDFDKESWLKLSGWKETLESDRKAKKSLEDKKMELSDEWDHDHKQALNALSKSENKPGYAKVMTNQNKPVVCPDFSVQFNGIEWARKATTRGGSSIELNISKSKATQKVLKLKGSKKASLDIFFFNVFNSKGEAERFNLEQDTSSTDISIKFKAHTTVSVSPDPNWYHSGYLAKIAQDNLWNDPSHTTEEMFGSKGIFHSTISGFIAVYQPILKITTSKAMFDKVTTSLKGSAGISFGPFSFGSVFGITPKLSVEGSSAKSTMNFQSEGNSLTFESTAKYPQIIAILVDRPVSSKL